MKKGHIPKLSAMAISQASLGSRNDPSEETR